MGRGLHFKHILEICTDGYLFHPHVNLKNKNYQKSTKIIYFPSIPPSITSTKINISPLFTPSKIIIIPPQKSLKPPTNQAFSRTCPKITHIVKKFHLKNHKTQFQKLQEITAKSNFLFSNTNQNHTLLSKLKNLSQHKIYLTFN